MSIFETVDWDSNAISDNVCEKFFQPESKKKPNKKKNSVIKSAIDQKKVSLKSSLIKKLTKRKKLPKNVDVNKNEAISLNDNKTAKFKSKLKKKQINAAETKNKQTVKAPEQNSISKKKTLNSETLNQENELDKTVVVKKTKKRKQIPNKNVQNSNTVETSKKAVENSNHTQISEKHNKTRRQPVENKIESKDKNRSLRERMLHRLKAARFRYLNEQIYTVDSREAQKIFKNEPEAFQAYHEGYRQQVNIWPVNPLDVIIKSIQKMSKNYIVADFGCGEAKLAKKIQQKVHSFDLVAVDDSVVACDMANVPLDNNSVDVAVFCLSLMGTNLHDYLSEANRVLKIGGILKIAEIESRIDNINNFVEAIQRFHFKNTWKDLNHSLFYFLDFKKVSNITNKKKLPTVCLNPCLYKKR